MGPSPHATPGLEENAELRVVLPGWTSRSEIFHLVYPSHRRVPARLRVFLDFMAAELKNLFTEG